VREDLLHFIWKYKKLQLEDLFTARREPIRIIFPGTHNHLSGPDFFNSKIEIDGQLWAGNVEIHLKSSDWFAHHHEQDSNYDNVILHVVWEDDGNIFHRDGSTIPTLELKNYISKDLLNGYQRLFDQDKKSFINCENDIVGVDGFILENWKERLFFERLESKSEFIFKLLKESQNDWEQVLFKMLLKNFGLKINGQAFLSLATALDFTIVRKLSADRKALESVFFGMSHLLSGDTVVDDYYVQLKREYDYQKNKFDLHDSGVQKPEFFRLRPPNFPTIRLSQLAGLYFEKQNLFSSLINARQLSEIYEILNVSASEYWNEHFTFGKTSKKSVKKLTKKLIDLLIINTLLPIKFSHAKYLGKEVNEEVLKIVSKIKIEDNSVISNFEKLNINLKGAKESQAMLQLYNEYCIKNRCLQCAVGAYLLNRNG